MALLFPHAAFRTLPTFGIVPRSTTGGTSMIGTTQTVATGPGLWRAVIPDISLRDRASNLLWSALEGLIMGRQSVVLVEMAEGGRQPFPASQPRPFGKLPHSDGSFFSDGAGYYQRVIVASLFASVARGAASCTITMTSGGAPQGGQHFSIGERLYRILSATPVAAGRYAVTMWPPARETALAGAAVEFERPVCRMRLMDDNAMQIVRQVGRFASPSLEFVEDPS